ncbi:hypothetical protein SAMN06295912_11270 [Sphingomonas laterariae]|uniref:Uncharacterized protein n=1 Tax=Edaphosphingomonas laterariae TaxID=861865 RepID=A0A239GGX7_9SPHN|nr:hypothetical protein [Sphingomonas laterariae]SNS68457.1 hypothetical protein SAMN06295912_11270 [Sphingomonas laterariae]
MRLSDDLAARRRLYAFPLATAPALLVIDIPRRYAGSGLLLGRYYPVIAETIDEVAEFERFLAAERPTPVPPDLLDLRPSARWAGTITFFEYRPPEPDWPWVLLCHWPADLASRAGRGTDMLARGAYTIEAFASRRMLLAHMMEFIAILGHDVDLRIVNPNTEIAGHA